MGGHTAAESTASQLVELEVTHIYYIPSLVLSKYST